MNAPPPPHGLNYPDGTPAPVRVEPSDARYPIELDDLRENAPPYLWVRGSFAVLDVRPRVAIVGTRRATPYGLRVTRELASAFVRAGACIVSGLAAGIDGAAHRAALDANGATIAILGTGLDHAFPKGHRELQATIAQRGTLISELEPDDHGMPFTFPERNRIIAALSRVTIVVEAPEASGALITAFQALELGRGVAAVPGPIDQPQSVGTNRLIRDGAQIVASVAEALSLAGLTPPVKTHRGDPGGDQGKVWAALVNGALTLDALCQASGLPAAKCLAAVTELEIAGSVECELTGVIRRR